MVHNVSLPFSFTLVRDGDFVSTPQVDFLAEELHPGTGWAEVEGDGAVHPVGVTSASLGLVVQPLTISDGPAQWLRLTSRADDICENIFSKDQTFQ